MARSLKLQIKEKEKLYYPCRETKAQISYAVTAQLICAFVFTYAKIWFSHDAAQLIDCMSDLFSLGHCCLQPSGVVVVN